MIGPVLGTEKWVWEIMMMVSNGMILTCGLGKQLQYFITTSCTNTLTTEWEGPTTLKSRFSELAIYHYLHTHGHHRIHIPRVSDPMVIHCIQVSFSGILFRFYVLSVKCLLKMTPLLSSNSNSFLTSVPHFLLISPPALHDCPAQNWNESCAYPD